MADERTTGVVTRQEQELKDQFSERPMAAPVRNINYDTHLGHAAQRPYARLEDQLAGMVTGWQSYEQLADRLKGTPDGPIFLDKDGIWKHKRKPVASGMLREGKDGTLERGLIYPARAVALTLDEAKAKSDGGFPTDYHDGQSWVWNGKKKARDYNVMQDQAASHRAEDEIEWEPVDPATQMQYRAQQNMGVMPFMVEKASRPEPAKKEGKD